MSRFEEYGREIQLRAKSVSEAKKSLNYSCDLCCCRGLRIECDQCAIQATHDKVVARLNRVDLSPLYREPATVLATV